MPSTGTPSPTAGTALSSAVELSAVSFGYGPTPVLRAVSVAVPAGAFVTLLGPSGCGKTTLLKVLAGYISPNSGTIRLHGQDVTATPPERRDVGFVFQNYALFPHLTARGNVAFPLEIRGISRQETRARVEAMLDRVRLSPAEWDRHPRELSGGQQQRVALARALVFDPAVLLLDEPLANLDRSLREQLRDELRRVQRETGTTTVLVTHDQDEAFAVSDYLGVMHAGRVEQFGPPREIYERPVSETVARALGIANLLPGERVGRRLGTTVMIRPEKFHPGGSLAGRITAVRFHGADVLADVVGENFNLTWRTRTAPLPAVGEIVSLGVDPADVWELPDS